jgi:hypothetical protein
VTDTTTTTSVAGRLLWTSNQFECDMMCAMGRLCFNCLVEEEEDACTGALQVLFER